MGDVVATAHQPQAVTQTVQDQGTALLQVIERAATNPEVDIEKMERLMAMHERIVGKQAEAAFNEALTVAQSEMGTISADAENKQTRSRYATYGKLDKALRPIYTRHGFALSFDTGDSPLPDHLRLLCHASHRAGHTRTYHIDMPSDGKGAKGGDVMTKTHATGAASSYGMRYLLKMIFNVAIGEEDTDGNGPVAQALFVSAEQAKEIKEKLKECNGDVTRFLEAYGGGAACVDEMPKDSYNRAIIALNKRIRSKA